MLKRGDKHRLVTVTLKNGYEIHGTVESVNANAGVIRILNVYRDRITVLLDDISTVKR